MIVMNLTNEENRNFINKEWKERIT